MGSVAALGCGVGKSATATAAAITAMRIGKCSDERCYIICPLNAMAQWKPYVKELKKYFKEVLVLSVDSLHRYRFIDRSIGGAAIWDEVHKVKNWEANRSKFAHETRAAFEWSIALTGTLLHTGAEGVLGILDVACPGLSRYLDKWTFGDDFNCIHIVQLGRRQARKLGKPPINKRDVFAKYLERAVCSLDYSSEEVKAVYILPEFHRELIQNWKKPSWLLKSERKEYKAFSKRIKSLGGTTTEEAFELENPYCWPPSMSKKELVKAAALSLMKENIEIWNAGDKLEECPGLPSFSAVMHRLSKMGNTDQIFKRVNGSKTGEPEWDYSFIGGDKPGPKLTWLLDFIKEEQLVVGAASIKTLDLVVELFREKGISFRLIRGGVSAKLREEYVKDFQGGKFQIMLLQQVAGSESVTLTKACKSILLDHDWSPVTFGQFLKRVWRQGQENECVHYDCVFNSIQEYIVETVASGEVFDSEIRAKLEKLTEWKSR
jgi:SNF2 family DNA or RNA helicase